MDEDLGNLAQQYALRRNIKLSERLGFGIHGTVSLLRTTQNPDFSR